jgi:hypothetical protein
MLSLRQVVISAIDLNGKAEELYFRLKLQNQQEDHTYLLEEARNKIDRLARANGFSLRQVDLEIEKIVPTEGE